MCEREGSKYSREEDVPATRRMERDKTRRGSWEGVDERNDRRKEDNIVRVHRQDSKVRKGGRGKYYVGSAVIRVGRLFPNWASHA